MKTVTKYASMIKFSHTVFAMPFALIGYVYAITYTGASFTWWLLLEIIMCMVFARNAAMGFNRWADRRIDAKNPRTAHREIPRGDISATSALWFVVANCVCFFVIAALINKLSLILAPVALFIILGYSYTKRFTWWSHIVLGVALSIAPVGAYIAVTGSLAVIPIILAGLVMTWVGGFDIIYSLQDAEFDRKNGLHSIPARFSTRGATIFSIALHLISIYAVVIIGLYSNLGTLYWIGAGLFIAMLIIQHFLATPKRLDKIGMMFSVTNGIASIAYAAFFIADLLFAYSA